MGFDESNCGPTGLFNPDFLGPSEYQVTAETPHFPGAYLYIDRNGRPFNLISLVIASSGFALASSKGGSLDLLLDPAGMEGDPNTFSGPEWTGIKWLLFYTEAGAPVGFDDLTVRALPTPGVLSLLGIGLAVLGLRRARRRA
jgi:hypothetical protein